MKEKTVLVADDCLEDQLLLRMAFAKANIKADLQFARDGEEAIQFLSSKQSGQTRKTDLFPELLLLDLRMPKMDGFDVLQWLRQQSGLKRLPVTVLTSSDEPKDVSRAYDLGANSYLVKPTAGNDYRALVEKIRDYWLEFNCGPDCLSS